MLPVLKLITLHYQFSKVTIIIIIIIIIIITDCSWVVILF